MDAPTLAAVLYGRARDWPDALAFTFGAESLTYRALLEDAARLAGALAGEGVTAGDRVALVLPAGLDLVRLFYAVQRLGAAASIFDPAIPAATTEQRIARIRPRLVLSSAVLPSSGRPLPPLPSDPDAVAFLQATSGTSGEPRVAILLQRNVLASVTATREMLDPISSDVLVGWVPPWHDLGLVRFVIGPVFLGFPCHLVTPAVRTIPEWLATISEHRGTISGAPDFAWRMATRLVDPGAVDLRSLRHATNGGEPVRASTISAFETRFGVTGALRPGYGLAEATLGVTTVRPGEPLRVDARGNVSCGRANPGTEVRVDAESGEILARSPAVFAGYFDDDEATAETLRDGWLHTGDAGHLDDDGQLYVLGRQRAMLKRGGASLAPRELEEAAQSVPGVRIAAAVGIPAAFTEEIVVVVEAEPGAQSIESLVAAAIEQALGFAPNRVIVQEPRTIPRTSNGKIRHAVLRESLSRA
jgi:acyl-CoA synthetase (AMP-forming)/AMP-acid ligase II